MNGSFDKFVGDALKINKRLEDVFYKERLKFHNKYKKCINDYKIISINKIQHSYQEKPHINPYGHYEILRENNIREIFVIGSGLPIIDYYIE